MRAAENSARYDYEKARYDYEKTQYDYEKSDTTTIKKRYDYDNSLRWL
ncbi:Uncharacterised protein [Yersinia frederiksenii]|nr:Uncharacterised protein [Yersinia frederiksenii]